MFIYYTVTIFIYFLIKFILSDIFKSNYYEVQLFVLITDMLFW